MRNLKFILKRLGYSVFVLIGLSILIFVIARIMPGDPARMALGARAPEWVIEKLREEMHLNEPIYVQYYYWFKVAIKGDLGTSLVTKRPVTNDIKEFFPATLELVIYTCFLMTIIGVTLGTFAGWRKNTWVDNLVRGISYIGIVTPSFVFAIFFMLIFGYVLDIFPTIGRLSPNLLPPTRVTGFITLDALLDRNLIVFFDAIKHIFLPAISLMMGGIASSSRITRSSVTENIGKDFIITFRSYRIPERVIMFKYLLKPSLIPTISVVGLSFAALLGNSFLVELIFGWPGIAKYGMNAMLRKDLNALIAVVLIVGFIFILVNLMVDLMVCYLDPRINLKARSNY